MTGETAPTNIRYRVIFVAAVMSVLLYLHRFCVSTAEVFIKEDLGLSTFGVSLMFGSFFFSYALGQPASGWLADRFGGRVMLTIYILAWTAFTGLLGLSNGIVSLVAFRLGLGLAQAGAYPTSATLIAKWVPLGRRGLASSAVALGGRVGGILAMFVTGYVILYFVPLSVPAPLSPNDILSEERLAQEIVYGTASLAKRPTDKSRERARRLLEQFPGELRRSVISAADQLRAAADRSPLETASVSSGMSDRATMRKQLADGLNQVMRQPRVFHEEDLSDVKLEGEANRLLAQDPSRLSASQHERLNRLVLEGLFPTSIKKIYGAGWRKTMILFGLLGLPVAGLFWWVCRDEPRKHPRVNAAELELIEHGRVVSASTSGSVGSLPLAELVASRSMWCNGAMQFFTNMGWVLLMTYTPRYFVDVHQIPVEQRAWMTMLPAVAGVVGMLGGGVFTDRMATAWGRRWGRSLPIALTRFAAGITYLFCLLEPSPWTATLLLSLTSLWCDLGIPAVWALQQDVGGKYAGSVLGWGNMWGNLGAFAGPQVISLAIGDSQNWNAVFVACAASFIFSGIIALGIDARQPIVTDGAESA